MTQTPWPSFAPPPVQGSLAGDRYRIGSLIGEGTIGVVLEATDIATGREVAIKWLQPQAFAPDLRDRFLREAALTRSVRHRNVVELLDVVEHGDSVFLVMERLYGVTLGALLARKRLLAISTALTVFAGALRGVAAAHGLGIIHRDLKPANILLSVGEDDDVLVKVLDFGQGKSLRVPDEHTLTKSGVALGTPAYMAPEQIFASKAVDTRADVFALGVILYEMITGELPFSAPSLPALAFTIMRTEAPRLDRMSGVDRRLADVVARALRGDAGARFANAAELLDALTPVLSPNASHAAP